jgi:hypothetical protein
MTNTPKEDIKEAIKADYWKVRSDILWDEIGTQERNELLAIIKNLR